VVSGDISLGQLRIDSATTASNIAPPSDSRLLDESIRVLCRMMKKVRLPLVSGVAPKTIKLFVDIGEKQESADQILDLPQ